MSKGLWMQMSVVGLLLLLPLLGHTKNDHSFKSKYVGQEKRQIKSLSAKDVEQLLAGKGWGLAKAAELNGMPGPLHVLEMKEELGITVQQEKAIQASFDRMKAKAIPLGEKLVRLERELDEAFATKKITSASLKSQLKMISDTYMELRFVHLQAHLETPTILNDKQVKQYNDFRGYSSGDPCENIPQGHDPEMWREHHGCMEA